MNQQEVIVIAKAHVIRRNQESPFHPDCEYAAADEPEDFFDCWYFDYHIIKRKAIPWSKLPTLGAAPGFVIAKADKAVEAISIHELGRLKRRNRVLQQTNFMAENIDKISLQELRKHFTLPLPELVAFKRTLLESGLSYDQRKSLLISQVMQEAELL